MSRLAYEDVISLYFHDAYTIKEVRNSHGVEVVEIEDIATGSKIELITEAAWELRDAMNRYVHWKQAQHRAEIAKERGEVSLKDW